ncbi:acetate kinase [soil metagenome]
MVAGRVLVLNAGSSSLKASLIALPHTTLARVEVGWGADASRHGDRAEGIAEALAALERETTGSSGAADGDGLSAVRVVGHRVVHGGDRFTKTTPIDVDVLAGIEGVSELAPLHNRVALETIEVARSRLPHVAHVACFDTAFHATLEPAAYRYPVPEGWYAEWGVRRYGFHGLSVAWSVRRAGELLGRDADDLSLVVAHLGSGCSVTAVLGGRSVDTSMGLTPLEGLMMGTRSGSIEPGVPLRLMERGHLTPTEVADALDHRSGLLGVSGLSADMRALSEAAIHGDERARLAIAMFVRRAAAGIAAVATSLPRLDAVVFTGGIGENAPAVRAAIVERLGGLGLSPFPWDGPSTPTADRRVGSPDDPVAVLRIEAREDLVIAAEALALLG